MKNPLLIIFVLVLLSVFSAQAIVLDWSGSYQSEFNFAQKVDFEEWGRAQLLHNLHLQPDIKAFDNVRVHSWFLLSAPFDASPSPSLSPSPSPNPANSTVESANNLTLSSFALQEGLAFGLDDLARPSLSAKALYMEIAHDFGRFQLGWKPHHFGMGIYYNDSSALFSPVYNLRGSRGFVSWRGFIGSSYYVAPLIHYIGENLLDMFIQGGYTQEKYGVELIFKARSLGLETKQNVHLKTPTYFGVYGYYKAGSISAHLEGGKNDNVYGGALDLSWHTPAQWLDVKFQTGFSSSNDNSAFYFDPSFSSGLSFLIEQSEERKEKAEEYLKQYLSYSFHSALYLAPSAVFSFTSALSLKTLFSTHHSSSDFNVLFYHTELTLKYQMEEGLVWNIGLSALFPQDGEGHLGVLSQAAITF